MRLKKTIIITLIGLGLSIIVKAQESAIDSLKKLLLEHKTEDTVRVNLLNQIASHYTYSDQKKSLAYTMKAIELADKFNYKRGKALGYNSLGIYYIMIGNYSVSFDFCLKSLKLFEEIDDQSGISSCYNNLGIIYSEKGNYKMAIESYKKSIEINENTEQKLKVANGFNNIGVIYYELENYNKALEYYKKSLEITEGNLKIYEDSDLKAGISSSLNNIALIYEKQNKLEKALEYYNRCEEVAKEINYENILGWLYNGKGVVYEKKQDLDKALNFYFKSLKIRENINDLKGSSQSCNNIGNLYLKRKQYKESKKYFMRAYKLAEEISSPLNERDAAKGLALIYEQSGNYQKSLEYHKIFKQMSDSLMNESNIKELAAYEINVQHDKELQAIELEQQKKDAVQKEKVKRQKFVRNAFIAGFILMFTLVLIIFRFFLQKRKANKTLASQKQIILENNQELSAQKDEISLIADKLLDAYNEVEKLSIVAKETDNAVLIIDKNDQIEWVNEGFSRMYGYQFDEFTAKYGSNIKNTSSNKNFEEVYEKCKRDKKTVIYESSVANKSGETIYTQTTLTPILNKEGNVKKLIAIDTDISTIKDLGDFKESMIQMIVHDLKNPLNSILGFSQLKPKEEYNAYINMNGKNMLNMVENILDVQKYENNVVQLNVEQNEIKEIANKAVDEVSLLLDLKEIKLENNLPKVSINCDYEILRRVFVNLLTNASKYVDLKGVIGIDYHLENENNTSVHKFAVSDNGKGINPEMKDKIFNKYAQSEAKKLGITHSTGLGLTFCKMVIEAHGGEIGVESEIEEGSVFWFTIPA